MVLITIANKLFTEQVLQQWIQHMRLQYSKKVREVKKQLEPADGLKKKKKKNSDDRQGERECVCVAWFPIFIPLLALFFHEIQQESVGHRAWSKKNNWLEPGSQMTVKKRKRKKNLRQAETQRESAPRLNEPTFTRTLLVHK